MSRGKLRVCMVQGCPLLTEGTRCVGHEAEHQRRREQRPGRAERHDPAYRRIPSSGTCHICGQPGADTKDHVIPLAAGGTNDPTNIRPAHRSCNSKKGYAVMVDLNAYERETR